MTAQQLYELFTSKTFGNNMHPLKWQDLPPYVQGGWEAVQQAKLAKEPLNETVPVPSVPPPTSSKSDRKRRTVLRKP